MTTTHVVLGAGPVSRSVLGARGLEPTVRWPPTTSGTWHSSLRCGRGAPGAAATDLFARQLQRAGHDLAGRMTKVLTSLLLSSAAMLMQT